MKYSDKLSHFAVCYTITTFFGFIIHPLVGIVLAVLAGAWKEYKDIKERGFDCDNVWDGVADVVGILLGYALILYV